jgi:hypothetical protein
MVMVPIPIANRYSVTLQGNIPRQVRCAFCQCEFVFFIKCTSHASGTSVLMLNNEGAQKRAQSSAMNGFENVAESWPLVPCPRCGKYQEEMVNEKKIALKNTFLLVGMIFGILIGFIGGIPYIKDIHDHIMGAPIQQGFNFKWLFCLPGVIIMICTFLYRIKVMNIYDPNASADDNQLRKQASESNAIALNDLLSAPSDDTSSTDTTSSLGSEKGTALISGSSLQSSCAKPLDRKTASG